MKGFDPIGVVPTMPINIPRLQRGGQTDITVFVICPF